MSCLLEDRKAPALELFQNTSEVGEVDGRRGLPLVSLWGPEVEPSAV